MDPRLRTYFVQQQRHQYLGVIVDGNSLIESMKSVEIVLLQKRRRESERVVRQVLVVPRVSVGDHDPGCHVTLGVNLKQMKAGIGSRKFELYFFDDYFW